MSAANIEARRVEAVRALTENGWNTCADAIESACPTTREASEMIDAVSQYGDRAALHALALLLAAMTEPT